jgi:hypothetical protein
MQFLANSTDLRSSQTPWTEGTILCLAEAEHTYEVAAPSALDHHAITAGGVKLYGLPDGAGEFSPETFGAIGDGRTDDSDAIERALSRLPEGGVLRFTAGRTYLIGRPITLQDRSVRLDARGATVRVAHDTVWHVFRFGGSSGNVVERVEIVGGTWHGNGLNQRCWPNSHDDRHFTTLGPEVGPRPVGRAWLRNSPINGMAWSEGWIDGSDSGGIDLNGAVTEGMIAVHNARTVVFRDCILRDIVRNGLVAHMCSEVDFLGCRVDGQRATNAQELGALFGTAHPAAALTVSGAAPGIGTAETAPARIRVEGCAITGGASPLRVRIGRDPGIRPEAFVTVRNCSATGFSDDIGIEGAAILRVSGCQLVGLHAPAEGDLRGSCGIVVGADTVDFSISGTTLINSGLRNASGTATGLVENCRIIGRSPGRTEPIVTCRLMRDCEVESAGSGVRAAVAENVTVCAEYAPALEISEGARGCRVGRARRCRTPQQIRLFEGQSRVPLGRAGAEVERIELHHPACPGRSPVRLDPDAGDYVVTEDGVVVLARPAAAGEILNVAWYAPAITRLRLGSGAAALRLPGEAPRRAADIRAVFYRSRVSRVMQPVPARAEVEDPQRDPHWAYRNTSDHECIVTLVNIDTEPGDGMVVTALPPLIPFAGPAIAAHGEAESGFAFDVVNSGPCRLSGRARISGAFEDIAGSLFVTDDPQGRYLLREVTARRIRHGVLHDPVQDLLLAGCDIRDWGMGEDPSAPGRNACFGSGAQAPLVVTGICELRDSLFLRSGTETAASDDLGGLGTASGTRIALRAGAVFVNIASATQPIGAVQLSAEGPEVYLVSGAV